MTLIKYYIYFFLSSFNSYMPFLGLFLATQKGFDNRAVLQFMAIYPIVEGLLEVPAGIFADRMGEKASLMVGNLLRTVAVFFIIAGSSPLALLGQGLIAAGDAFCSGSDHAMLFHCFRKNDYGRVVSNCTALSWAASGLAAFLGYFLAKHDVSWPFIATGAALTLNTVVIYTLPRIEMVRNKRLTAVFTQAAHCLVHNPRLRYWFLVATFLNVSILAGFLSIQALLNETGLAGAGNGLLFSAVTIFAVLGSLLSKSKKAILADSDPKKVTLTLAVILSLCFWIMPTVKSIVVIGFAMCLLRLVWGYSGSYLMKQMNNSFDDHSIRSTILSCHALICSLFVSAFLFAFSKVFIKIGTSYYFLVTFTMLLAVLAWVWADQGAQEQDKIGNAREAASVPVKA
jgi:hypothetical protein